MRKLELTGKTFNRLTVLKEVGAGNKKDSLWLCQCECGNTVITKGTSIKNGITKSCGCLAKEAAKEVSEKIDLKGLAENGYDNKRVNGVATFLINDKLQKNSTTRYKGVRLYRLKDGSTRYMAYLTVDKKRYSKRGFMTASEAHKYRLFLVEKYVPKK